MAKTPEGDVKGDAKKLLDSYGDALYYFMPVQQGFGKRTTDFLICYKGMFLAAEAKRIGGRAKRFQEDLCEQVRDAHGHTVIFDSVEDLKRELDFIDAHF